MRPDLGYRLLTDGYLAIPRDRAEHGGGDAYTTRLLGRRTLVVRGRDAVRRFYDPELVRRRGAVPRALGWLLFGPGAVHLLDGEAHAHRKAGFVALLDEDAVRSVADLAADELRRRLAERPTGTGGTPAVELLAEVYGVAVLRWVGVDATPAAAQRTSRRLLRLVDGFGGAGRAYARAWLERIRLGAWARDLVRRSRQGGRGDPETAGPLDVVAHWRDRDGRLLPATVAGVELLNVLRPTVAVAYLGGFALASLEQHPERRRDLADPEQRHAFVQEVRRLGPFVPALAGKLRRGVDWDGTRLGRGHRVVLDVPGTNRCPASWHDPEAFRPQRFVGRAVDPWELVPQGGGLLDGHRCPGESLTVALLERTLAVLAEHERWRATGSGHSLRRIPAREGVRLVDVVPRPGP
jgi:fatty-acid peroxygenase